MAIKTKKNKAQSFLEYSLLIAVGVVVLIIMQHYFGRGVMGLLKQNVDNLGAEKVTSTQFKPGKWRGAQSTSRIATSGFDYEGRMGFGVSTGSVQRSSVSKITNAVQANELVPKDVQYETQTNGKEITLINQAEASGFDSGAEQVEANIEQNTKAWHNNSGTTGDPGDENVGNTTDTNAENIVNDYVEPTSSSTLPGETEKAIDEYNANPENVPVEIK